MSLEGDDSATFGDDSILDDANWEESARRMAEQAKAYEAFLFQNNLKAVKGDDSKSESISNGQLNPDSLNDETFGASAEPAPLGSEWGVGDVSALRSNFLKEFDFQPLGSDLLDEAFGDDDADFNLTSVLKALEDDDDMQLANSLAKLDSAAHNDAGFDSGTGLGFDAGWGGFPSMFSPVKKPAAAPSSDSLSSPAPPPMSLSASSDSAPLTQPAISTTAAPVFTQATTSTTAAPVMLSLQELEAQMAGQSGGATLAATAAASASEAQPTSAASPSEGLAGPVAMLFAQSAQSAQQPSAMPYPPYPQPHPQPHPHALPHPHPQHPQHPMRGPSPSGSPPMGMPYMMGPPGMMRPPHMNPNMPPHMNPSMNMPPHMAPPHMNPNMAPHMMPPHMNGPPHPHMNLSMMMGAPGGVAGPPGSMLPIMASSPPSVEGSPQPRPSWFIPLPAGFRARDMSKQEMALIIRMQLSQLSTSDPTTDDFYNQVYCARKGQRVPGNYSSALAIKAQAQLSNKYRNPDGSIVLPEGTLGRISTSSLHRPKALMNLSAPSDPSSSIEDNAVSSGPARTNMFANRSLAFLIEEGYRCLMNVEDVDSMIASLGPQPPQGFHDPRYHAERARLMEHRKELMARLAEAMDLSETPGKDAAQHLLLKFAATAKGRLLVYRALSLMGSPHNITIVSTLMHQLRVVALPTVPMDHDEKLYQLMCDVIAPMPFSIVVICIHALLSKSSDQLVPIIQSKLGCMLLRLLLKKAHASLEQISRAAQPDETMQRLLPTWRNIFEFLMSSLHGKFASLFDGLEKSRESKEASSAYTTTTSSMWDFIAALTNLCDEQSEQRQWLASELKELLQADMQRLTQTQTSSEGDEKSSSSPAPLPSGFLYLQAAFGLQQA